MDKSPPVARTLLERQRQFLLDGGHDRKPPPGDLADRSRVALWRPPTELG
jgi:hypothetical protein